MWDLILEPIFELLGLLWTDGPRKVRIGCTIVFVVAVIAALLLWIYWHYS